MSFVLQIFALVSQRPRPYDSTTECQRESAGPHRQTQQIVPRLPTAHQRVTQCSLTIQHGATLDSVRPTAPSNSGPSSVAERGSGARPNSEMMVARAGPRSRGSIPPVRFISGVPAHKRWGLPGVHVLGAAAQGAAIGPGPGDFACRHSRNEGHKYPSPRSSVGRAGPL